jgi:hypothetical protein
VVGAEVLMWVEEVVNQVEVLQERVLWEEVVPWQ